MENRKQFIKYFGIILLILGGLGILGKLQDRVSNDKETLNNKNGNDFFEVNNFMGGSKKEFTYPKLRGGIINNVMGGSEIDLRTSNMDKTATIEVFLLMGGAKIMVPKDWNVSFETINIMGGTKDQIEDEESNSENTNKTLIIKGTVLMGGLQVKRY